MIIVQGFPLELSLKELQVGARSISSSVGLKSFVGSKIVNSFDAVMCKLKNWPLCQVCKYYQ